MEGGDPMSDSTEIHELTQLRQQLVTLQARLHTVEGALKWLVHLHFGRSKSGGFFVTDEEWNEAIEAGKTALATPGTEKE
jgi:hypothetical protein